MDRHADKVEALWRAVLETPGATDRAVREAAMSGGQVDSAWQAYIETVREASHRLTAADFERLAAAGYSEDAILEMTLAAAVGAATVRLGAGLRAVRAAQDA